MNTIVLVGCGNMGFALLTRWRENAAATRFVVIEPSEVLRERAVGSDTEVVADAASLPADLRPELVVFAVKPQVLPGLLPYYRNIVGTGTLVLSVAAGIATEAFERLLSASVPVVRCMPNTPASIGHGMLVCFASHNVTATRRAQLETLLSHSGSVVFIEDEAHMDAVTAVSGSGPAYVFYFIECLQRAAVAAGLPAELAGQLALGTAAGASFLARESTADPAELRRQVTSPQGTTAAALDVLMGDGQFDALISRAVNAAKRRSIELKV